MIAFAQLSCGKTFNMTIYILFFQGKKVKISQKHSYKGGYLSQTVRYFAENLVQGIELSAV